MTFRVYCIGSQRIAAVSGRSQLDVRDALKYYPSKTFKKRLWRLIARCAPAVARIESNPLASIGLDAADLLRYLSTQSGLAPEAFLIIWPRGRPDRIHIHMIGRRRRLAFAKVALSSEAADLIENEGRTLLLLSRERSELFAVPRVFSADRNAQYSYVVCDALPADAVRLNPGRDPFPRKAVAEFSGQPRVCQVQNVSDSRWLMQSQLLLSAVAPNCPASSSGILKISRIHGDFGSENVFAAQGRTWIIDWERSSTSGPSATDEVAYGLAANLRLTRYFPKVALTRLISDLSPHASVPDLCAGIAFLADAEFGPACRIVNAYLM